MKKSLMLLLMLLLTSSLMFACGSSDDDTDGDTDGDKTDGDTTDGDKTDGDTTDGDTTDGDTTDGDATEGETSFVCSGTCPTVQDTKCVGEDLCFCEATGWKVYDCDTICGNDNLVAKGCGLDATKQKDYCICGPAADGDVDGDATEGETASECKGSCDNTFTPKCVGEDLCACDETTMEQTTLDCDTVCEEDPKFAGSVGCQYHPTAQREVCVCYTEECQNDQDCVKAGKAFCKKPQSGPGSFCVAECQIATCTDTIACMDAGIGDDCGICFDFANATECDTDGTECGTGKVCTDLCGVYSGESKKPGCYETCKAVPSTCADPDETCYPRFDAAGKVVTGECTLFGDLNCETCGEKLLPDGDVDADDELAEATEVEAELTETTEAEAEVTETTEVEVEVEVETTTK